MSVTLATVADALIEFILSLLRDPDAAAEFDQDPTSALSARGLSTVTADDVCAVAPVVLDRSTVVPSATPAPVTPAPPHTNPVVNEIRQITNNFSYVDDRDTVVDQSVNQSIWAHGDVTQIFDQAAVTASGDGAVAAGDDVTVDQTQDHSTTITAGDDVNIGNDTENTTIDDSYNTSTDASTTTDDSTTVVLVDSLNDGSTTQTVQDSYDSNEATTTDVHVDSDTAVIDDSDDAAIVDTADDGF